MARKTGRSRPRPLRGEGPVRGTAGAAASARREATPATRVATAAATSSRPLVLRVVWALAAFTFLWFTWQGIERQITWYLAVDQFGYLTFAHDLLHGRVFHHWKPLEALDAVVPKRTDLLAQTYVRDGDVLYCRYAPGFPIVLASWIALLGDDAAHYLNPTIYMALLVLALAFQWRAFRSPWRAGAGVALIALCPTLMHLWGLTLTRDLAAHLAAFAGLFVLLPARGKRLGARRVAVAALALGFAVCIRPDGVIYVMAAVIMAAVRWVHERATVRRIAPALAAGAVALVVGAAPFLAFNWAATGNPLIPTQGMELSLIPPPKPVVGPAPGAPASPPATEGTPKVGYPSPGWRGGTTMQVQGGGVKLSNLNTTLPGNWRLLLRAYSPALLGLAAWGVAVAVVLRPVFAAGAVAYCLLAFLFYSCWPRPDGRYLTGVFLFLPMLMIEGAFGTLDMVRLLSLRRQRAQAQRLAVFGGILLLGVAASAFAQPAGSVLLWVLPIVGGLTGVATLLAASWDRRRLSGWTAIAVMLCLVALKVDRVQDEAGRRAPFQRPQMYQARANMQKLIEPGSVVITSEEVGRPAENIEYYSGVAHALYLTDLKRWRLDVRNAAARLLFGGQRPYLYLPASQPDLAETLATLREGSIQAQLVADLPADRAMAHFVAAPFHRGVRMQLYRLSGPIFEAAGKAAREGTPPPAGGP